MSEKKQKKQTNADYIRSMSDEELAEFMCEVAHNCEKCGENPSCEILGHDCRKSFLGWLKAERE